MLDPTDRLIAALLDARAAEARAPHLAEPGAVRRATAALQRELGCGDLVTAVEAFRWERGCDRQAAWG